MLDLLDLNISKKTKNAFKALLDHWIDSRDGNSIPRKSDINPMNIHSILPEIVIMERIDQDSVVYRLAGTELAERSGFDLTGLNTLDTFPPAARKTINDAYLKAAEQPCGAYLKVAINFENDLSHDMECLYLPLSDDEGVVRYLIALLFVENKEKYYKVSINKNIGYEVPSIKYIDIGFGTFENDQIASHVANITKPK